MHRGYIKIWRKVKDSGLYQLPNAFTLFVYMLTEATHKPIRFGTVDLERGQLSTGRHILSSTLKMSEQSVRTALKHLHNLGMITSKSTSQCTVYTIVNYNNYQDSTVEPNQQINQPSTNDQPTTNQHLTTIQEHKNIRTKEENKPLRKRSSKSSIKEFLEECSSKNERRIPEDDPVFDYAEQIGIPLEMIKVCWNEFVRTHLENGKTQNDWRATFRNYVRKNYYKLWFIEVDGSVKETQQYRALKKMEDANV